MWQLCWTTSWLVGLIRSRLIRPAAAAAAAVTEADKAGAAAQAEADARAQARAEGWILSFRRCANRKKSSKKILFRVQLPR